MQPQADGDPLQVSAFLLETPFPEDGLHLFDLLPLVLPLFAPRDLRGEGSADEEQELLHPQGVDVGPLQAEDGPEGGLPGDGALGADAAVDEGREVGGEALLGEGAVGHPEGVVEALPELAGVGLGEGAAGGEEGLERFEGGVAEVAICGLRGECQCIW